jgi:hypothetical protein
LLTNERGSLGRSMIILSETNLPTRKDCPMDNIV